MPPSSKNPPTRSRPPTGQQAAARAPTGQQAAARPPRKTGAGAVARPAVKLVCTAGPASGQEFPLSGDEVTIGRAAEATVSVPDTSVSRKHALVRRTAEGWAVSDLGSGNGTIVNGETIADEQPLSNDDVITLGDSEFQFVEPGGAGKKAAPAADDLPVRRPPVRTARAAGGTASRSRPVRTSRMAEDPAQTAKKKRRLFIVGGSSLAVLMALFVGYKAIVKKREEEAAKKNAAIAAQRQELGAAFQEAKNLIKDGRWIDGRARLEQIVEFDPEYEKRSIGTYLERSELEMPNERAIAEAQQAIDKDELGRAAAAIAKVKNTIMEKQLSAVKERVEARVPEKVLEARKKLAGNLRDLAIMEQVKAVAEDVIAARPEDRDAPELKKQAEDAINRIKNPNLPPPIPETPHVEVMQRFRNGDLSGAVSLAQACAPKNPQCRALDSQLRDFDNKLKNLETLQPNELRALYLLDKKIAGGQSSDLSKPIRIKVAAVFSRLASNQKTIGDWVGAIENARIVLDVDSAHPGAMNIVQEGRTKAHDIYLRGYQLRETSPDEAARLFKEVMAMTPADDVDHQKAAARLQDFQRQ